MENQLLLLELNEVNFDYIEKYVAAGKLPNFARLIKQHGLYRTTSEDRYERLEPWIQWVTAHTGKTFLEHGVFRLGDIVGTDIPQIWEVLEGSGLRVGAISPMNAKYRLRDPAFFVPDPWTRTQIKASAALRALYAGLVQAVNGNAESKLTLRSACSLLAGAARYAAPSNYRKYLRLATRAIGGRWRKALFVDLLLSDVFIHEVKRSKTHFATLFLNAAAHIQHHYMFCSLAYSGPHRNPLWYVRPGVDPVFEAYSLYDEVVGNVQRAFPRARLMLATGLHQVPHEKLTFYWRLKDHELFLRSIGIRFVRVEPRMSRDFLVVCESAEQAKQASVILRSARVEDGTALFEVDERKSELFVMLVYPREIDKNFRYTLGDRKLSGLHEYVAFVALKNGEHNGIGYFLDTGMALAAGGEFPLSQLPSRVLQAFGIDSRTREADSLRSCAPTHGASRSVESLTDERV